MVIMVILLKCQVVGVPSDRVFLFIENINIQLIQYGSLICKCDSGLHCLMHTERSVNWFEQLRIRLSHQRCSS